MQKTKNTHTEKSTSWPGEIAWLKFEAQNGNAAAAVLLEKILNGDTPPKPERREKSND